MPPNRFSVRFGFVFLLPLFLSLSLPDTPPLSDTLSLSLFIIHGAVTVRIKVPRNVATATTEQKQPHWIMGNWVTSQEQEWGVQQWDVAATRTHTNTHARACAHTPDRRPTKQEDREERGDDMERQDRQNQAGQRTRCTDLCKNHM